MRKDVILTEEEVVQETLLTDNVIDGDIIVEDNTLEEPIIPERPSVVKHEQFELFAPLANYKHAGLASFDPESFVVERGRVKNRRNSAKAINDIKIDGVNNIVSFHYNDGSVKILTIPDVDFEKITNSLTVINIAEQSWIFDGERYYFVATSTNTGRTDDNYFVSVELKNDEYCPTDAVYKSGHSVLYHSCFKAADGSLILWSDSAFEGRLLLMTSIFTNELVGNEKVGETDEGYHYNQVFKDDTVAPWIAPRGPKGDASVTNGQPTFFVRDGNLYVRIIKGTENPYRINENGDLVLTIVKE